MKFKRKVIAVRDEQLEDGLYTWDFYKRFRDLKAKNGLYEKTGFSITLEDVKTWIY